MKEKPYFRHKSDFMRKYCWLLANLLFMYSCQSPVPEVFDVIPLGLSTENSGTPNLFVNSEGQATLIYIEKAGDTLAQLKMAVLKENEWSEAKLIAQGDNWFVNWADFPALAQFPNKKSNLAAHWLQKRAAGTYDYDIRVATSLNNGESWSESFLLHQDGVAAEHGFVTLLPIAEDRIFATWLDGRNTKVEATETQTGHGHGGGAMTLRTAEFDLNGNLYEEAELDTRVCDCCQTDAVITEKGPIVVYRDRSEQEIRDISIVRKVRGVWSDPQHLGNDHWQINGCPVNGPAIAAYENQVAVVWFTMAADTPKVQVAFSQDFGASFGLPIQIDQGNPLGRVDIVFGKSGQVLVSYLEDREDDTLIRVVPIEISQRVGPAIVELSTNAARKGGFPVLEKLESGFLLATTEVNEKKTQVKTYLIQ